VEIYFCVLSCLLFYSNYTLHVSVIGPSSCGNIFLCAVRLTCVNILNLGFLHPVACISSGSRVSV
jgi:hypothetical protein